MGNGGTTEIDLDGLCTLIEEASAWNGGWLNVPAYSRWRAMQRAHGRVVPSQQHLAANGVSLFRVIGGMGIPTAPLAVPDDQLLGIVAMAHRECGTEGLPVSAYRHWRDNHPDSPSTKTLLRRFGSWGEVLKRAGIVVVSGNRRFTDADLIDAIRRAKVTTPDRTGLGPSMNRYEAWRKQNGAPSAPTISRRFGGWPNAIETAFARHQQPV